ncbi:MAG: T9SS type A sorting domain-containing protein [Bacteroidota bacterium]
MRFSAILLTFFLLGTSVAYAQTTWTGAAGTAAWCDAANWDAGVPTASTNAFVRGGAVVYPLVDGTEPCTVTALNLDVNDNSSGGRVTVSGGILDVVSTLETRNSGGNTGLRLTGGIVTAAPLTLSGDHAGRFTGGELQLSGFRSRISGVFRPAGTLVRITSAHRVIVDDPGITPGRSFFENVVVEAGASLTMRSISALPGNAWFTGSLSGAGGASGFQLYFTTQLPTLTGSYSTTGATYFYGTRTIGTSESYTFPGGNLEIGNTSSSDGLGGRIRVAGGGTLTVPGSLTTYTNAEGQGLVIAGGEVETRALVLNGDASANYVGGELRLTGGLTSRVSGVFRPSGTLVRVVGTSQVIVDDPGITPGRSFFENVVVEAGASLTMRSISALPGNAWFTGSLSGAGGASGFQLYFTTQLPALTGSYSTTGATYFLGTRVLGPGQSYALPSGDLEISDGGQILVGGGTLTVPGRLTTESTSPSSGLGIGAGLVAVNTVSTVGDHTGRFIGGELQISGSGSRFAGIFRPSGTLVRYLTGAGRSLQTIMDNAGTGPGQNYFRDLLIEGTGTLSMRSVSATAGNVAVIGRLTMASSRLAAFQLFGTPFLASPRSPDGDAGLLIQFPVTVSGVNVDGLVVDSNGRLIVESSGCLRLDNTDFPRFSATEPRLTVRHPGGDIEFNNLTFSTPPSNLHLAAEDTAPGNLSPLRLFIVAPDPATATEGTNYTQAGGADVRWDAPPLGRLPVTLALEPAAAPPVVIPSGGGPLAYEAMLTNTSAEAQTFEARIVALLPGGAPFGPLQGPLTLRIPAGQTIGPIPFTETVPGLAPAGAYEVVLEGTALCPEASPLPDAFTFEKEAGDGSLARPVSLGQLFGAWTDGENEGVSVAGVRRAESASDVVSAEAGGSLPEVFALHAAYPNPSRGAVSLGLGVPATREVRVEVFDTLGRRVALLHDGPLAAGEHTLRLRGEALPAGVYVVRAADGAAALTQRITLLR